MTNGENNREVLMVRMVENLPMLRVCLELTQEELAKKIGSSRSTIHSIENKKRKLSWNTFLSLMHLFCENETTNKLLDVLEISMLNYPANEDIKGGNDL